MRLYSGPNFNTLLVVPFPPIPYITILSVDTFFSTQEVRLVQEKVLTETIAEVTRYMEVAACLRETAV